jgi:hypothetical protein
VEGKLEHADPELEQQRGANETVVHVVVDHLERMDVPGRDIGKVSRDFH